MNFLVISNNEHSFAIRSAALEVADMIQGLIEKSILEVAPHIAPVPHPVFNTALKSVC
jgi:hypothetical protein